MCVCVSMSFSDVSMLFLFVGWPPSQSGRPFFWAFIIFMSSGSFRSCRFFGPYA